MATIRNRNGRWHVQVRKTHTQPVSNTFTYRKDAEQWAKETERQLELGQCVRSWQTLMLHTTSDLMLRYEDEYGKHKPSYHVEKYYVRRINRQKFSQIPLAQLKPQDIQSWLDSQLETHKPSSIVRCVGFLSAVYSMAIKRWHYPMENPLGRVALPRIKPPTILRISSEDKLKIYTSQCLTGVIAIFALETAMRRGEILNLKWSDVDLSRRLAHLRDTKNGHARYVPLTDRAMAAIEQGDIDGEYVFPMTANALRLAWTRFKKKNDIGGVRFHDLRHEAISRFFELGLTVPEVASISGHRTVSMLFRYAHADLHSVRTKLV